MIKNLQKISQIWSEIAKNGIIFKKLVRNRQKLNNHQQNRSKNTKNGIIIGQTVQISPKNRPLTTKNDQKSPKISQIWSEIAKNGIIIGQIVEIWPKN